MKIWTHTDDIMLLEIHKKRNERNEVEIYAKRKIAGERGKTMETMYSRIEDEKRKDECK